MYTHMYTPPHNKSGCKITTFFSIMQVFLYFFIKNVSFIKKIATTAAYMGGGNFLITNHLLNLSASTMDMLIFFIKNCIIQFFVLRVAHA